MLNYDTPEEGDFMILRNIVNHPSDYMVSHPINPQSEKDYHYGVNG